jgi:hypothetical protein
MSNPVTVEQVFEVSIAAERAVEDLFHGLEAKFAPYADLVLFWRQYAAEEAGHVRWLLSARARLSPEQLASPVSAETVEAMRQTAALSVAQVLSRVTNLQEAYELVLEIESGETNAILLFLLDHFEPDPGTVSFLRAQLNSHVAKLATGLPAAYQTSAAQRKLKAVD